MIEQIYTYFTIEILYFWVNLGVIPFWLLLIFFPNSKLNVFLVTSIFPVFLLSSVYIFLFYKAYLSSFDFLSNFNLYLGIQNISELFSSDYFLLMFWTHFVTINLFVGGWIVNDSQKYLINKILVAIPLITTYLIGPIGILIYWLIRVFYAKKISLYD